jgi:hypothetical protein
MTKRSLPRKDGGKESRRGSWKELREDLLGLLPRDESERKPLRGGGERESPSDGSIPTRRRAREASERACLARWAGRRHRWHAQCTFASSLSFAFAKLQLRRKEPLLFPRQGHSGLDRPRSESGWPEAVVAETAGGLRRRRSPAGSHPRITRGSSHKEGGGRRRRRRKRRKRRRRRKER